MYVFQRNFGSQRQNMYNLGTAHLTLDELANSLRASLVCPQKSLELSGKYEYNQLLKGVDVKLSADGAELAYPRLRGYVPTASDH